MTGFEVYKMYLALKLHFTTDRYDYFEFNIGNGMFSLLPYDSYQIDILQNKYNIARI